jgi:hypothetical protein
MRKIPGNEHFRSRIEYTSIVDYYFGRKAYIAAQIGLNGALQSLNIISVIQSAQVMDNAISAMFGHSCGINLSPFALHSNGTKLHESTEVGVCAWRAGPARGQSHEKRDYRNVSFPTHSFPSPKTDLELREHKQA